MDIYECTTCYATFAPPEHVKDGRDKCPYCAREDIQSLALARMAYSLFRICEHLPPYDGGLPRSH